MDIAKILIGLILLVVVAGGLLYLFYSRSNAVEKTGYGSLIMLAIVSLLIPLFWIQEGQAETQTNNSQQATAIERGMIVYTETCVLKCFGIDANNKVVDATYNGYKFEDLTKLSDDELKRVISSGTYNGVPSNTNLVPKSEQYGGQLGPMDVPYLMAFIHSTDPNYAKKNGFTDDAAKNGLELIPAYLQNNAPSTYQAAKNVALFGQFGEPVDMTSKTEVNLDILDVGQGGAACSSQVSCFTPINIKVKVGTKLTWTNKSKVGHTVTAIVGNDTTKPAPQIFDSSNGTSSLIATGETFSYTVTQDAYNFDSTNHTVTYFCKVHPDMVARITIVP